MNYILSIILAVAGIFVLIRNKSASIWLRHFFSIRFKESGGTNTVFGSIDPNKPVNAFTYRMIVIFAAIFMLIMAFHFAFGPIYTGSASQNGSILQTQM
jgi:hypothetical protein